MKITGFIDAALSGSVDKVCHYKYLDNGSNINLKIIFCGNLKNIELIKNRWSNYYQQFKNKNKINRIDMFKVRSGTFCGVENIVVDDSGFIIKQSVQKISIIQKLINDPKKIMTSLNNFSDFNTMHFREIIDGYHFDDCIVFSNSLVGNYYHWIVEAIPRLNIWNSSEYFNKILLLPESAKSKFHRESLEFFGVDYRRVEICSGDVKIGNSFFTSKIAHTNTIFSPIVISFYEKYRGRSTGTRKIYISRSQASFRRIQNEFDLIFVLSKMGFECLNLEEFDFESQVKIFQNTHICIAPHGAGLANSVFMPIGSNVIELISSSFAAGMTSYSAIAEAFQLNYTLIIGEAVDSQNSNPANFDFLIPIDDLVAVLPMEVQ